MNVPCRREEFQDRIVEREAFFVDQFGEEKARENFGDGTDLEERVFVDGCGAGESGCAE